MNLADLTNGIDIPEIALALFSGTFAVIVAWVAFRGKAEEAAAEKIRTLTEGQANRITALEDRLGKVEERLSETQKVLRRKARRVEQLHSALRRAVDDLDRLLCWVEGGSQGPLPRMTDLEYLKSVIEDEDND